MLTVWAKACSLFEPDRVCSLFELDRVCSLFGLDAQDGDASFCVAIQHSVDDGRCSSPAWQQ